MKIIRRRHSHLPLKGHRGYRTRAGVAPVKPCLVKGESDRCGTRVVPDEVSVNKRFDWRKME
jgi:hypothetical protein